MQANGLIYSYITLLLIMPKKEVMTTAKLMPISLQFDSESTKGYSIRIICNYSDLIPIISLYSI